MTRSRPTFLAGAAAIALGAQHATLGAANEAEFGTILVDSKGRTLYLFRSDSGSKSTCSGACDGIWPPLRATGKPATSDRASASLVGSTTRSDGERQVTYNGHPLCLYAGDEKAGDTRGQGLTDFGSSWYVLTPAGRPLARLGALGELRVRDPGFDAGFTRAVTVAVTVAREPARARPRSTTVNRKEDSR